MVGLFQGGERAPSVSEGAAGDSRLRGGRLRKAGRALTLAQGAPRERPAASLADHGPARVVPGVLCERLAAKPVRRCPPDLCNPRARRSLAAFPGAFLRVTPGALAGPSQTSSMLAAPLAAKIY